MDDFAISSGSTYDGPVALIAKTHGEELLTRDSGAVPTYESIGVQFRVLGHD